MVQRAQNKMLRVLDGAQKLMVYQKSTKCLLEEQNMLSVNQMAAQIKLTEMKKASNDPQYPIKIKTQENQEEGMGSRSGTYGDLTGSGGSARAKKSFTIVQQKYGTKHQRRKGSQIIGYGQKKQSDLAAKFYLF